MKKCILFAGVVGCSKTPTAIYLSQRLCMPVFNNDAIRTEVTEDLEVFDEEEYVTRRDKRLLDLVQSGNSFILDASIDREYERVYSAIAKFGYEYLLISFDLSRKLIMQLYQKKKYFESLERIDQLIMDHENFLNINSEKVNVVINDSSFVDRLEIALSSASKFINN